MENVTLDFRCASCSMVRRTDANLSCSVVSQLPDGWQVYNANAVVCPQCVGVEPPPDDDEGYMKVATEALYRNRPRIEESIRKGEAELAAHAAAGTEPPTLEEVERKVVEESKEGQGRHTIPRPDKPMDPYRQKRADERREAIKDVHLTAASTTDPTADPFSARGRQSGDLTPPTTTSTVPVFNEICPLCTTAITEVQSWVPDPKSAIFTRVHRDCLRKRVDTEAQDG